MLCLTFSQRSLRLSSFLLIFFVLILLLGIYFHCSIFQLTYWFFSLSYHATDSFYCICHFSYCVVHYCLFFSSSRSLLNISYILLICTSILFPRFWIIFTITTLNSFSCRLPISFSFIWSFNFLLCSFLCNTFLCHLTFVDGWGYVSVLLVVCSEVSITGPCQQLGGVGSWCWDEDLWESSHWLIFPGAWNSLVIQWLVLSREPLPGNHDMASHTVEQISQTNKTHTNSTKLKANNKNKNKEKWKETNTLTHKQKPNKTDKYHRRQIIKQIQAKKIKIRKLTRTTKKAKNKTPKQTSKPKIKINNKNKTNLSRRQNIKEK